MVVRRRSVSPTSPEAWRRTVSAAVGISTSDRAAVRKRARGVLVAVTAISTPSRVRGQCLSPCVIASVDTSASRPVLVGQVALPLIRQWPLKLRSRSDSGMAMHYHQARASAGSYRLLDRGRDSQPWVPTAKSVQGSMSSSPLTSMNRRTVLVAGLAMAIVGAGVVIGTSSTKETVVAACDEKECEGGVLCMANTGEETYCADNYTPNRCKTRACNDAEQ